MVGGGCGGWAGPGRRAAVQDRDGSVRLPCSLLAAGRLGVDRSEVLDALGGLGSPPLVGDELVDASAGPFGLRAGGVPFGDQHAHLALQFAGEPGLLADDRELRRAGPSYSFDTLTEMRAELGEHCALTLIVGADAFAGLDTWHRWRELTDLAHIVVMARPDSALPETGPVAELLRQRRAAPEQLSQRPCGAIVPVELTPLPVSATRIRGIVGAGRSPRYLVPDSVWTYIREQQLYRTAPIPAQTESAVHSQPH